MEDSPWSESTEGRALNRMLPPLLALHPRLDLCGFRVSLISDRAPFFLFVFCTCLDQAGARFGLGLTRRLCFCKLSIDWKEAFNPERLDRS